MGNSISISPSTAGNALLYMSENPICDIHRLEYILKVDIRLLKDSDAGYSL